jgi:energy-coupling factor transporter ATP-binding protein EcfA2
MARKRKLQAGFTIGGEQAEADPLHEEAFVETDLYHVIEARDDHRCFVIGRTGSGKSAALQHLEEVNADQVIRISPEDLALPYITDLQVIKFLDSLDVKLDLFWFALWKHVLVVEIIRRRYKVDSPEAKQRFLGALTEKLRRDPAKQAALQYLEDFEGRFWVEADERVRQITKKFTDRIGAQASGGLSEGPIRASGQGELLHEQQSESTAEVADRYQRIVNETQLARLNQMLKILDDDVLDAAHFTYVVIDDLDRDWVDDRISNDLIRCLFRTVLDMQKIGNLKVLVALRTNIFQELDFGRSGGQEEKFRALVLEMKWNSRALTSVLDNRMRVAAARSNLEATSVKDLLPHANRARGNPLDYMLSRTLMRPRDAIAFFNECLAQASDKAVISWEDIQAAEKQYSPKRLLALRDEWKPTYPGIDSLLEKFRGAPARMTVDQFRERLDDCILLVDDPSFSGVRWLTDVSSALWNATGESLAWPAPYVPLVSLLFKIGLVGGSRQGTGAPRFVTDDPLLMSSEQGIGRCDHFYVHRTFHRALDVVVASEVVGEPNA